MSRENIELVRRLQPGRDVDLVALFRDEVAATAFEEAYAPFFHDDLEVVSPPGLPGSAPRYFGLAGLRAGWLDWLEPWERYRVEVEGVVDAGDEDVVVLVRDYGRRLGMAAEVSLVGGAIWTVTDGKVARIVFFLDRKQALEAAGLSN
jgi:ketosteroid isomerase-like protein